MARTKKQTLVNACERRRQIQEEIHRETLAAKQKKENFVVSHTRENLFAVNTNSSQNGVTVSEASHGNIRTVRHLEKMDCRRDLFSTSGSGHCLSSNVIQADMSSLTQTTNDTSSLSEGSLPKAVICIPDICRSPTKPTNEELSTPDSRESNSRGRVAWERIASDGHRSKPREDTFKKQCGSSRQSDKNSSTEDVIASLRSLKAASEKVREEKSRKSRHESCAALLQTPSPGRRSPRRHSPLSSDSHQESYRKDLTDSQTITDEKPKVNIFTDNLGLDLGKRIRSPRRLSEDMIALPIFSARRWSNCPKENSTASFVCSKTADEAPIADEMETDSLNVNLNSDSFKSPGVFQKSLFSPGTSKSTLTDELLRCIDNKSTEGSVSPQRHCTRKSNDNSLVGEKSELQTSEGEKSKSHPQKNSESVVSSQELRLQSSDQKCDHCCVDDGTIVFDDRFSHASTTDNLICPLDCKKTVNKLSSSKVEKDTSNSQKKEDVEKMMSSICRELMSDGVLIKCENRFENDSDDSSITLKIETPLNKDFECKFNKENAKVKDLINININSNNSAIKTNSDIEKEITRRKPHVETSVSLDTVEEKPQSSLLCAMLVGGTEVAHSYSQERVRIKPQAMDSSDSELDMLRNTSHYENRPSDSNVIICIFDKENMKLNSVPTMVNTVESDAQDLVENKQSGEPSSVTDKIDSHENKVTSAYEQNCIDNIDCVKMETDVNGNTTEDERPDTAKKEINLSNQLKKLDEVVLKLMEIDLEEEFLKEIEIDDMPDEQCVDSMKTEILSSSESISTSESHKTALFSLISALGSRLRVVDSQTPFSTPVDIELVDKLIQSCPTRSPTIIPKLKTVSRMTRIYKRLEEEKLKGASHTHNTVHGKEIVPAAEGRKYVVSGAEQSCTGTARKVSTGSDQDSSQVIQLGETFVNRQIDEEKNVMQIHLDVVSGNTDTPSSIFSSALPGITSSNSLGSQDLDAGASVITSVDGFRLSQEEKGLMEISEVLQTSSSDKKFSNNVKTNIISEVAAKHSFQKSRTCDDFNEKLFSTHANHAGKLRRVNSSPQINTKPSLMPASPSSPIACLTKDSHTKSKLGSKIPVPGTSYVIKNKKSWRTPRTIIEPKPLSVLSELENKSVQPTNIFTCQNLHKYLNIPSNRIIVRPEKREEMKIIDARAQEEEEEKEKLMQEREDIDKKSDEEINIDYRKFEPDFDEVDGMLFMSFYSEVELRAHVRVEKALEWDKDDTMLRVSRAKAFEEAKAQHEDMGHFKLKHLRGQHMRWKKYRRLYSNEVKALLEAQNPEKSFDKLSALKKTSDVSKVKGWKRKHDSLLDSTGYTDVNSSWSYDTQGSSFNDSKDDLNPSSSQSIFDEEVLFMNDDLMAEDSDKLDLSPRSRRRQGFSHQKAHRQLFRELKMDWQDRMIHRKLGGWSLKGNRPQAFSSAAKKRQEKKVKETDTVHNDIKDITVEECTFEDGEIEMTESKGFNEGLKKKKVFKIFYPLLTEKMARNALKTIETGDIQRGMRRKKRSRHSLGQLPALTPVVCKLEPGVEAPDTPLSECTNIALSPAVSLLSPPVPQCFKSVSSSSSATMPLEIDLQDEPVMEGVDIASENISSPSVSDNYSLKSCGKPGCRYGCICHLCSVSETSAPLQSPITKQPSPACDKEYCRLGCICDSIDPEKPISNKTHCRRPSCMLQCICPESGSFDGNEDIPYLPSMRRRPKPGERFSNLPQREKTHRSAKNLDAVTRKAMMLYETSEIYCERVERVRKRTEPSSSPTTTCHDGTLQTSAIASVQHMSVTSSSATFDINTISEPSEENIFQPEVLFTVEDFGTAETTPVSHLVSTCSTSPQHQHPPRNGIVRISKPAFILDDVRQTVPIVEPSAHKRKRKSHPLSDEIFISSTCARTQPFKQLNPSKDMRLTATNEDSGDIIEISPPSSTDSKSPSVSSKTEGFKLIDTDSEHKQKLPKISSVHTLASDQTKGSQQWENMEPETALHQSVMSPGSGMRRGSKNVPALQHTPPQGNISNVNNSGNLRQPYGWHKSMVCLKARAPPSSHDPEEEDVKEEDEVKLLEFAANCNWEGAKREILAKVAQCLTRGQYPQPRTMNVCEFVVEILPKAHQPSHIPPELRAKLPGQMYSIRVRITRRESIIKREDNTDVIDLSGSSPVKSGRSIDCGDSPVDTNIKEPLFDCGDHKPTATSSDSFLTSSFGISGFNKLVITSPPVSGQVNHSLDCSNQCINHTVTKPVSAPNSRRSSTDSATVISFSDDHTESPKHHILPIHALSSPEIKLKGSSFMRLGSGPSLKAASGSAFNSESIKTVTNTTVTSNLKLTSCTTSKKSGLKSLISSTPNQPLVPKTVSTGVAPIFGPFSAKDVKYMIPGKDGTMQLIEVGQTVAKNKKLIAVPITLSKTSVDLKGKQSTMVALPVSGMGQSRVVPLLNSKAVPSQLQTTPTQQIVLRLPTSHSAPVVSGVRHPVVLQPLQSSIKGQPPRFQVVPLHIGNCVAVSQNKMLTTMAVQGSRPATLTPKPSNSSDEMIMVFDAAHIKPSHLPDSSALPHIYNSKTNKGPSDNLDHSTSVTDSRDGLVMSSAISLTKLQTHLSGAIDLTEQKMPLEDVQLMPPDTKNSTNEIGVSDTEDQLDKIVGHVDVSKECDADSSVDCNIKLLINSPDLNLKGSMSSSVIKLQESGKSENVEISMVAEVSDSENIATHSKPTLQERNVNECGVENNIASEIITSSGSNLSCVFPYSSISGRENTKTLQEPVLAGSKRHLPTSSLLEEPMSPYTKKPCLIAENPFMLDEDSVASFNSMSGIQQAAASPLSNVDRPKSVMSGALSTGSSDDLLILLSSEEDIDVGEDDKPDNIISYRTRVERALENDHGSMYTKVNSTVNMLQSNIKIIGSTEEEMMSHGLRHEGRGVSKSLDKEHLKHPGRNLQKVRHHNQLERLRRSRMRVLFDELQQHVLKEKGLPKDHVMSKVKVLVEAKKVVLQLSKMVHEGDRLVKDQERKHKTLLSKLAELKANLMQQNISAETISSVMKEASEKYLLQEINAPVMQSHRGRQAKSTQLVISRPLTIESNRDESQDMVNMFSPQVEKISDSPDATSPVYEEISDPEDFTIHKYEDISDVEEKAPTNESVYNSESLT